MCKSQEGQYKLQNMSVFLPRACGVSSLVTDSAFSRPCPPHDGNAFSSVELETDILQDIRAILIVPDGDMAELNRARPRPTCRNFLSDEFTRVQDCGPFHGGIRLLLRLNRDKLDDSLELQHIQSVP